MKAPVTDAVMEQREAHDVRHADDRRRLTGVELPNGNYHMHRTPCIMERQLDEEAEKVPGEYFILLQMPFLDKTVSSLLHSLQIIYGMNDGKRVEFPRGPAAVTEDESRESHCLKKMR